MPTLCRPLPRPYRFLVSIAAVALTAGPLRAADAPATVPSTAPSLTETVALVPLDYRHRLVQRLSLAEQNRDQLLAAIARADPAHREAVAFLVAHMPERDLRTLSADFLLHNVALAYEARAKHPWAAAVPDEIFLNDVLPYANLNERREDWRSDFAKRFAPVVADCTSAGEAAQLLNKVVFPTLNVQYHATKRPKPDQCPSESTAAGFASCSGLSILLADACRAVGVPARVAGTPLWADKSGNHTWVEVWDGQWRFVGAAEPGPFNQTWFAGLAAKADDSKPEHRIYAASFRQTETPFILVWDVRNTDYPAVDVTGYYVKRKALTVTGADADAVVDVRQGGVLVAQAKGAAKFELAADADYAVTVTPPGGKAATKDVRLGGEDQTVDVGPAAH